MARAKEDAGPVRDDRKELVDAEWRKLQAKRHLQPPGLRDADGPAILSVRCWA
jgi:hypothetical protein